MTYLIVIKHLNRDQFSPLGAPFVGYPDSDAAWADVDNHLTPSLPDREFKVIESDSATSGLKPESDDDTPKGQYL